MTRRALTHVAMFLVAFGVLYRDTLAHILNVLSTAEGSHGFLILAVSLFLIWNKRKDLKAIPVSPALLPGALLGGLGCFMLFAGKLANAMLLQQISIVPTLFGGIWLFLGFGHLKALLFPVGYLIFLTGIVEEILGNISVPIQTLSAWIASRLLGLIGMPVLQTSTVIELPHISLEVVKECSGINHIVALLALALPLAYLSQRTLAKKCILVLAALVIGIFANGLRVALIGVYSSYDPLGPLHGPAEALRVSSIFFVGIILLIMLSHFLGRGEAKRKPSDPGATNTHPTEAEKRPLPHERAKIDEKVGRRRLAPGIVALAIFTVTLGFMHFYKPEPVRLQSPLRDFPMLIGGFQGKDLDKIDQRIRPFSADDELLRVYEDAEGNRVELYIGYFEIQDRERKIVDYRRDWMHQRAVRVPVGRAEDQVCINKTSLREANDLGTVFFWYDMGGKIITSRYEGKFRTLLGSFVFRKTNAAVVVTNSVGSENKNMPLIRDLVPMIHAHLSGT